MRLILPDLDKVAHCEKSVEAIAIDRCTYF
jgi:hypothetical protein